MVDRRLPGDAEKQFLDSYAADQKYMNIKITKRRRRKKISIEDEIKAGRIKYINAVLTDLKQRFYEVKYVIKNFLPLTFPKCRNTDKKIILMGRSPWA